MSSTRQVTPSAAHTKLINDALANYTKITGITLSENPYASTLKQSNSPKDILKLLKKQGQEFEEYRKGDHRLISYLSPAVKVFQAFSKILGGVGGLVSHTCHLASLLT